MRFEGAALAVVSELNELGLKHALIGGFAVSIRTAPRFTRDIDLVVAVADDVAAEKVVRQLSGKGFTILALIEHEARERLATVRLGLPGGSWVADLLFASSGIESEIVDEAEPMDVVKDLQLPVARVGHLLALKLLARDDTTRPQDLVDIRALLQEADDVEIARAKEAVSLIESRGYARGRDLESDLRVFLEDL